MDRSSNDCLSGGRGPKSRYDLREEPPSICLRESSLLPGGPGLTGANTSEGSLLRRPYSELPSFALAMLVSAVSPALIHGCHDKVLETVPSLLMLYPRLPSVRPTPQSVAEDVPSHVGYQEESRLTQQSPGISSLAQALQTQPSSFVYNRV